MRTKTNPATKPDSSMDEALNPVRLPDGTTVAWAIAFPRRSS